MKKCLLSLVIFYLALSFGYSQISEPYKYVWAKNGLNLRVSPSTSSKIISKIPFGDSLIIIQTTEIRYTNKLLGSAKEEQHPLFLKSNWVEVLVNNEIGFLIDGYLLEMPCPIKEEPLKKYLHRMATNNLISKFDGVFKLRFGNVHFKDEKIEFVGGKTINYVKNRIADKLDRSYSSGLRYFQGFKPTELIVFLDPFYNILDRKSNRLYVVRNWTNYLNISNNSSESFGFTFFDNEIIIMYYQVSC